jgi:hypothetical protein
MVAVHQGHRHHTEEFALSLLRFSLNFTLKAKTVLRCPAQSRNKCYRFGLPIVFWAHPDRPQYRFVSIRPDLLFMAVVRRLLLYPLLETLNRFQANRRRR